MGEGFRGEDGGAEVEHEFVFVKIPNVSITCVKVYCLYRRELASRRSLMSAWLGSAGN